MYEYGLTTMGDEDAIWNKYVWNHLEFVECHTETSQLLFVIRKRRIGDKGQGDLYMVYPFSMCCRPSEEEMEGQLERIRELNEGPVLSAAEFQSKLDKIRLALFARYDKQ